MPQSLFPTLLNMSITAGVVIVVVLLVRLPLKRAPKIFSYVLWAVVLFRLLCPVSLTWNFSLMNLLGAPEPESGRIEYVTPMPSDPITPALPADPGLPAAPPAAGGDAPASLSFFSVAGPIWLCGACVLATVQVIRFLRLRRRLTGAVPLRDNIWLADHIPTPFVLGLFRPRIYLPSSLPKSERPYIILHEQHHIRRGDPLFRLLAFAALCLHWFNPLVWLAFVLSGRDMELSCDEAVMKQSDRDIRGDYSSSLLRIASGKPFLPGTPLAFGEGDTKERIVNVMKYKKPKLSVIALCVALCLALTACLASNPLPDAEVYENQELGFRIEFPDTWKGNYSIEEDPRLTSGVTVSTFWGGLLGTLHKQSAEEWALSLEEDLIPVPYHVLHEGDDHVYVIYFASDVNYDLDDPEQVRIYEEMKNDLIHNIQFTPLADNQPEARGTTEVFTHGDLSLQVTNVREIVPMSMLDHGTDLHEYSKYVCWPEATVTVLGAGMNPADLYEDGLPRPQYGFLLPDLDSVRITEDLVTQALNAADLKGAYHLESSLFVLEFEIQE